MSEVREIFYFWNRIITNVKRGKLCLTGSDVSPPWQSKVSRRGYERYARDSPIARLHCG